MPSVNKWGRENPNTVYAPEGAENVKREDAPEHGYWGIRQDTRPASDYTVAGVTGSSGGGEEEGAGVQTMSARTTTKSSSKS